ncbi:MAG: acylphosphatase [Terriglobia bacterium]
MSGQVQGVGYRYFAEKAATRLGIRGYVKNLWDGSVEVYAVGEESELEAFKRQLAEGPRAARVTEIEESEEVVRSDYRRFVVEYR